MHDFFRRSHDTALHVGSNMSDHTLPTADATAGSGPSVNAAALLPSPAELRASARPEVRPDHLAKVVDDLRAALCNVNDKDLLEGDVCVVYTLEFLNGAERGALQDKGYGVVERGCSSCAYGCEYAARRVYVTCPLA